MLYLIADAIIVQPTSWRLVSRKNIHSQINDKKVYKGILSKSLIFFFVFSVAFPDLFLGSVLVCVQFNSHYF